MSLNKEQLELYQELVEKAWESTDFKKELIENPKGTIENVLGKEMNIPTGKKIVVLDQTDESTIFINIPRKVSMDNVELTEDQLEAVSGGDAGDNGLNPFKWVGYGIAAAVDGAVSLYEWATS